MNQNVRLWVELYCLGAFDVARKRDKILSFDTPPIAKAETKAKTPKGNELGNREGLREQ